MNVLKITLSSALLAGATLACLSAQAAPACASVSPMERRIVERANGDVDTLRNFVVRTSVPAGVNMYDVRVHLDQWRAAIDCQAQVAATEHAAAVAAAQPAVDATAAPALVAQR